ncbi:MAG: hypothetical protein AB7F86_04160 [Bdellovibrionales bacterium]
MKFILSLLLALPASAKEIVIQAPQSDRTAYRAYMKAHPDLLTPTDFWLAQLAPGAVRPELMKLLLKAQKSFLEESLRQAKQDFRSLADLSLAADWGEAERETLLYAHLRLAHLASSGSERESWIEKAALLGINLKVDTQAIPPPIVAELEKARREIVMMDVTLEESGEEWTTLLVNGQSCSPSHCQVPRTDLPVRFTWLSDKWQTVSTVEQGRTFPRNLPAKITWAQGECGKAKFSRAAHIFPERQLFTGLDCAETVAKKLSKSELSPLPLAPTLFQSVPSEKKSILRSPWLWAGIGTAIVTALIIHENNKKKDSSPASSDPNPEPTTTYGY